MKRLPKDPVPPVTSTDFPSMGSFIRLSLNPWRRFQHVETAARRVEEAGLIDVEPYVGCLANPETRSRCDQSAYPGCIAAEIGRNAGILPYATEVPIAHHWHAPVSLPLSVENAPPSLPKPLKGVHPIWLPGN